MVGGKGESYANIGEGLATGLQCFEDLQQKREPSTASQKHCILICNSPPYQIMIQECYKFAGKTIEQLAAIYQEVSDADVVQQECDYEWTEAINLSDIYILFSYTYIYSDEYQHLHTIAKEDPSVVQIVRESRWWLAVVADEELCQGSETLGAFAQLQLERTSRQPRDGRQRSQHCRHRGANSSESVAEQRQPEHESGAAEHRTAEPTAGPTLQEPGASKYHRASDGDAVHGGPDERRATALQSADSRATELSSAKFGPEGNAHQVDAAVHSSRSNRARKHAEQQRANSATDTTTLVGTQRNYVRSKIRW